MPDDILKGYSHAMVVDPESGKPMMKVAIQGSGGSGGDIEFPSDFPDSKVLAAVKEVSGNTEGLDSTLQDIATTLKGINNKLDGIVNGTTVITVKVQPEEEGEE